MPTLYLSGQKITASGACSVLNTLRGKGHHIPFSCQSGVCQSCLMVAERGEIPPAAQAGLTPEQIRQGLFLSCSCYPQTDLHLRLFNPLSTTKTARVIDKKYLRPDVLELVLDCSPINYRAGQYVTLWRNEGIARSYSLASVAGLDRHLHLHIRLHSDGQFSSWAASALHINDTLQLQGPMGECCYDADNREQPLLLIGTGTGIAPLYSIVRDALHQRHKGPITLIHAAQQGPQLYFSEALRKLAQNDSRLSIREVAQTLNAPSPATPGIIEADIYDYIRQYYPALRDYCVYLCGAETFIQKMRKQCFLAGVRPRNIHADAFVIAGEQ